MPWSRTSPGRTWTDALALPGFGGALLEGVTLRVGPAFELWLAGERRRLAAATAAMLQEATHDRLARRDPATAVPLALRLVACDPLDERGHELLVRSLMAADEPDEAAARVQACEELFRRELGRAPSPALRAALSTRPGPPRCGAGQPSSRLSRWGRAWRRREPTTGPSTS